LFIAPRAVKEARGDGTTVKRNESRVAPIDGGRRPLRLPIWALSLVGFVSLWQLIVWAFRLPPFLVPAPSVLIHVIASEGGLIGRHLLTTLSEAATGLAVAIPIGLGVAGLMHGSRAAREIIYPHMVLAQAIPLIALAPIVLVWFGMGILSKILIVSFVCFFPISVNAYEGFRAVDRGYHELLVSCGATRWQQYRHLYLPAVLPNVFAGLKLAATYCVLGAVVGEWLGGVRGMGIYMTRALQSFRNDRLFAAILVIMLTSVLLFKGVDWLGNRFTPWIKRRSHG
jgi:putative hydroxymethylpyrimidine transport system permease protein